MGLVNCQKAGKFLGGLGAAVGPQAGCRGDAPAGGLPPEAEEFLHFQPQKVAKKAYLRRELMANELL